MVRRIVIRLAINPSAAENKVVGKADGIGRHGREFLGEHRL